MVQLVKGRLAVRQDGAQILELCSAFTVMNSVFSFALPEFIHLFIFHFRFNTDELVAGCTVWTLRLATTHQTHSESKIHRIHKFFLPVADPLLLLFRPEKLSCNACAIAAASIRLCSHPALMNSSPNHQTVRQVRQQAASLPGHHAVAAGLDLLPEWLYIHVTPLNRHCTTTKKIVTLSSVCRLRNAAIVQEDRLCPMIKYQKPLSFVFTASAAPSGHLVKPRQIGPL